MNHSKHMQTVTFLKKSTHAENDQIHNTKSRKRIKVEQRKFMQMFCD